MIGARLGETVLAGARLLADVELLASGELLATSEENSAKVRLADFLEALKKTPPSLLPYMFLKYQMAFS